MDLNRETAMRLWRKTYGKDLSGYDFAGRKIAKSAYNDRNSDFAWNIDHIYPQSRGGATNDSNLVVSHILTNDEKADKFPCFTANGQKFEIHRVQNHYEIVSLSNVIEKENKKEVDFFDFASGLRLYKNLKKLKNKERFVGSVFINIKNANDTSIIDFIKQIFDSEDMVLNVCQNFSQYNINIMLKNYNIPFQEDTNNLLEKCIMLNTYLKSYFMRKSIIQSYYIIYRVDYFSKGTNMYREVKDFDFVKLSEGQGLNALLINNNVAINIKANQKFDFNYQEYCIYDYVYKDLSKNLIKEASK